MIILITAVVALVFVYLFYSYNTKKFIVPKGLKELPLEKGVPILGILPQVQSPLVNYLKRLSIKNGPLYKIKIGMRDIVVMNNFDTIKKALRENGDAFSGRSKMTIFSVITRNSGILFIDGDKWAKQRSFILTVLRDFGLGKSKSQEIVQNECLHLLEELREIGGKGKSVDFAYVLPIYTANIISKFIMNKRFPRGDPKLKFIEKFVSNDIKNTDFVTLFLVMFPILDISELLCKFILTITFRWKLAEEIHSSFREEIEEHRKRLDLNSEGEDLIDRFLIKQNEIRQKTGDIDTFTDWQLIRNSLELFIAGYESTSTALGWSLLFMSRFPDIQEKVYLEIIEEIGLERMVTMNDKKSLNYSQAVMDEIMRLASVAPLAVNHRTLKDTEVNGYFIPKDSIIFPNLFACHTDPNVWENPMDFKPERFLIVDKDGKLKYNPREELIAFSMGKRQCLGESLARMEYLIFFVSIFQHFKVSFSEKLEEKKYEEVLLGNDGFIRFSKVKDFTFSCRHQEK